MDWGHCAELKLLTKKQYLNKHVDIAHLVMALALSIPKCHISTFILLTWVSFHTYVVLTALPF